MRTTRVVAVLFSVAASAAWAGPQILSYQAVLQKSGGSPVADGTYLMRFTFFDAAGGNTPLWTETQPSVQVSGGMFSVSLGAGTPFGSLFSAHSDLWLEVAVDINRNGSIDFWEAYDPRQQLAASAWAMEADRLQGKQSSDFAAAGHGHTDLQRRVTGAAPPGQFIRAINADGSVVTAPDRATSSIITAIRAGSGLTGGGTSGSVTLSANANYLQRRVTGTAPKGQFIRAINGDGTVITSSAITRVTAGTGLTGGGTSGPVTLAADTNYLQRRVISAAPAGQYIRQINADGTIVTGVDRVNSGTITAVAAGTGLTGGGTSGPVSLGVNTDYLQRRVTGTAPPSQFIRAIYADGTVMTGVDQVNSGTITAVTAGTGLTGGGTSGTVALAVRFAGSGTSESAARADHSHSIPPWVEVTTDSLAAANWGYMVNSPSLVTITLPTSATLAKGDTIRICGAGAGGWKIALNAGQKIRLYDLRIPDPTVWSPREGNRAWFSIASSADGTKLIACVYGGQIYTSWDSALTWTARETNRNWMSVASSADGTKLVASVALGGQIYTSSDSGVTWMARESNRNWRAVASSADGAKLVACVYGGRVYTSSDSGNTWTTSTAPVASWNSVASSADGTRLVACGLIGGIATSWDSGATWTTCTVPAARWYSVASSSDGTKLVAGREDGQLYTSSDSGTSWTARASVQEWKSVASSADGSKLIACVFSNGGIYISSDSGANWTKTESNRTWIGVALSADGTRLFACVYGGQIYAYGVTSLTGSQGSAIELLYVGGDTFLALSYVGSPSRI
jgi:photosystem II stability/assembly factor-like uncharacterized protein